MTELASSLKGQQLPSHAHIYDKAASMLWQPLQQGSIMLDQHLCQCGIFARVVFMLGQHLYQGSIYDSVASMLER